MPRSSMALGHRAGCPARLLAVVSLLASSVVALVAPAGAAPTPTPAPGTATTATGPVPVTSLTMTGTTTTITVHRVFRSGQVRWINHVISTRLLGLDGCQARRVRTTWKNRTYRATVHLVCADGPARSEAAIRALVRDRPWYRAQATRMQLVGFELLADLPTGNDQAVPAALAQLPSGPFTFSEGDDLSLSYVGQSITQAELDAAVAAFARALGVPASKVGVTPLATS